jgi:hypothetical protein
MNRIFQGVVMKTVAVLLATTLSAVTFSAFADNSDRYPLPVYDNAGPSKSRAAVVAELNEARASGQIVQNGEQGFVAQTPPSTLTRAQVAAEAREANRLGLTSYGEQGPRNATPTKLEAIRVAGQNAVNAAVAKTPGATQAE